MRFSFLFPHNVWLGVSIDKGQIKRIYDFLDWINNLYRPPKIFISFEPLLAIPQKRKLHILSDFGWIIIGRLTGWGKRYDPPIEWIKEIVKITTLYNPIPVFLKDNLKGIWQGELIQEMPKLQIKKRQSIYDKDYYQGLREKVKGRSGSWDKIDDPDKWIRENLRKGLDKEF